MSLQTTIFQGVRAALLCGAFAYCVFASAVTLDAQATDTNEQIATLACLQ